MYLTETKLLDVTKRQFFYKFKAYSSLFFSLVTVQILSLLSSMGGSAMMGTGVSSANINVYSYSSNIVIGFTLIWAFTAAIIYASQAYRNADFAYVSNRMSSNLSSIALLLTAGIAGGVMAALSGVILRVIMFFSMGSQNIASDYFFIPPQDLLIGMLSTTLYIVLVISAGYFICTLVQISKGFIILLPPVFILALRLPAISSSIISIIGKESSLLLFTIKVLVTAAILFSGSILLSNRLEVRR